jgi:hypothetical protein
MFMRGITFSVMVFSISCNLQVQYHFRHYPAIITAMFYLFLIFRSFGTVFGAGLLSVGYACGIQYTSDDVVSRTGKVFYSAAADQYNTVLL